MCGAGTEGEPLTVTSNYFELISRPEFHLWRYRVDFSPEVDHKGVRKALLRALEALFGKYVFDGTLLYSTNNLSPQVYIFVNIL